MKKTILATILCVVMLLGVISLGACSNKQANTKEDALSEDTNKKDKATTDETSKDSKSEGTEKTKLTFMGWGNDAEVKTFQAMIDSFEAEYTDVEVEYIVVPNADYMTKLQGMIASGTQPDVFYCNPDYIMQFAMTGNLYNMTDYVANNDLFEAENVWPSALDFYRFDGNNVNVGDIYALPKDVSAFAVVYNKDLFASAGVEAPTKENPWTWDDYLTAAQKLTSGDGDEKIYGSAPYSLESAIWANGADWLDSTYSKITIDDPKFIEALQWCADLRIKHGVVPTGAEEASLSSYDRFMQGKLGMMGVGSWAGADLWSKCDFEWDLMAWPVSPSTGKTAIWYGGSGLAVSPNSENVNLACDLAAYIAFNEDAQRTSYKAGQSVPTLKDMAYGEYMEMDAKPDNKEAFLDILADYGRRATQTFTFSTEWWNDFHSGVAAVLEGEMTAEKYCTSIKDDLQSLLDDSIAQKEAFK
ncbi:MAG: sugar ABC transporter substrate-binding protein [Anaerolineaceae bacterium]|nr:MAG: sugar ABC transporter substrate-binding protein [Anaerolineaceae bacterium]